MSDVITLALISSTTTVVMGLISIITIVLSHSLSQTKLDRIEHQTNSAMAALQKRAERQEEVITGQLPAETNPQTSRGGVIQQVIIPHADPLKITVPEQQLEVKKDDH